MNLYKKSKNTYRQKNRKTLKGGSPASNRVMNFLPQSCNSPSNFELPAVDNNISNMKLYANTGGGRKLKGGAIRMSSEYFGVNSGRYQVDANVGRSANSFGYTLKGGKRSRRTINKGGSPASNRVMSFLNNKQNGGAIRMPSEYFGVNSGRYQADANVGRSQGSYGYMNGGQGNSSCCPKNCSCTCKCCKQCTKTKKPRRKRPSQSNGGFIRSGSIQNFRP